MWIALILYCLRNNNETWVCACSVQNYLRLFPIHDWLTPEDREGGLRTQHAKQNQPNLWNPAHLCLQHSTATHQLGNLELPFWALLIKGGGGDDNICNNMQPCVMANPCLVSVSYYNEVFFSDTNLITMLFVQMNRSHGCPSSHLSSQLWHILVWEALSFIFVFLLLCAPKLTAAEGSCISLFFVSHTFSVSSAACQGSCWSLLSGWANPLCQSQWCRLPF
jgi:hypothetical protein